jgi:hypothetical protein
MTTSKNVSWGGEMKKVDLAGVDFSSFGESGYKNVDWPKFPKDDVAEEPVKDLEEMVDKRRVGRPPGRKERITLNMSQEHIGYLKSRDVSYSKTIARLIDKELNA